jgi:hypothetical protein
VKNNDSAISTTKNRFKPPSLQIKTRHIANVSVDFYGHPCAPRFSHSLFTRPKSSIYVYPARRRRPLTLGQSAAAAARSLLDSRRDTQDSPRFCTVP